MLVLDLNHYPENLTCGDIARDLIADSKDPSTLIRFMRGSTKVFITDSPSSYWAGTAVQESTKGEDMKHVRYRANQIQTLPTEEASGVGLMVKYEHT